MRTDPKRSVRGGRHRTSVPLSGGSLWHQRAAIKKAEGFQTLRSESTDAIAVCEPKMVTLA